MSAQPNRTRVVGPFDQKRHALLDHLAAKGITAETRAAWDSPQFGRYARLHDPEGNPIELWEPATDLTD